MDGTKAADDGGKLAAQAARPTVIDAGGEGAAAPLPDGCTAAKKALDGEPAAPCGEEEEADDKQVERFYALLANIRAVRSVYTPGGGGGPRKRLRSAEPPWRPAFRLEDFEDDATCATSSRCAEKEGKGQADGEGKVEEGGDPAVAAPSRSDQPPRRASSNSGPVW